MTIYGQRGQSQDLRVETSVEAKWAAEIES